MMLVSVHPGLNADAVMANTGWPLAVSVLASEESLLDNQSSTSSDKPLSRGRAPGYLLSVLAIVILTAESLLYHRRKVG